MDKKKVTVPLVCHGHSRPVVDLFYSPVTPDGFFLISASKDSTPMLRNGETGDWIGTFEGHKGAVWSCCLDSNALRAASASADFSAKLWDALTGDVLHSFEHKHIVRACAFAEDTHLLLTGGFEKILRIFDLNRPDVPPREVDNSPGSIRTVAWLHSDQTILSSCSDSGGVRLWDVRSNKVVRTLETKSSVTSTEVSQDGRYITTADGSTVKFGFARIFKRLSQECGMPVLMELKGALEAFVNAKERSKQCVAAEALAGLLHSDVSGLSEAWDNWMMVQLQSIILAPSVESIPEWAACIRYAVTGKGKYGTKVPLLRQRIMNCLIKPLPQMVTTTVVAKRYAFISAALIEVSPPRMPAAERQLHDKLLEELLGNMSHSSAQVRESIGVTLSVLCSNIRLNASFTGNNSHEEGNVDVGGKVEGRSWDGFLVERASELVVSIQNASQSDNMEIATDANSDLSNGNCQDDVKWMETLFHFVIASLKSGRSTLLLDVIVGLLYPVISLQETSNKDLSTLAKAAFELLKWRVLCDPHLQKAVSIILSSANDSNWRTRSATLTFLRSFMYRHTFILSYVEKQQIWKTVEKLLSDNQVEVREHAAAVLAGLMKGEDGNLAEDFRGRAYTEAKLVQKRRKQRNLRSGQSIASTHGLVLALAASVLSVPYDMPSWLPEHVTLLAQFVGEPSPVKSTVTKAVAEFRRTHADTWTVQKDSFTEEQLEVLADTSSSSSYFA